MGVTRFEVLNLRAIRAALDHHNASCSIPARAILLNPVDWGLLRWNELWGLPVYPSDEVRVKRFRIDCEGRGAEDELPEEIPRN